MTSPLGRAPDVPDAPDARLSAPEEGEALFRQMAESVDDVFWLADPATHRLLYVSPAFERLWGIAASAYMADPSIIVSRIHPVDREGALAAFETTRLHERAEYTYRILRPDGAVRWVQNRSFPVYDAAGRLWRRAGIATDVTDRKETERALQQSEARFRALVDQAADPIFSCAPDGRLLEVNRATCETLGYTRDELLRMSVADISVTRDAAAIRQLFARVIAEGALTVEGVNRRKNGSTIPVEIHIGPVRDGGTTHLLGIARDLTERRAAEAALRESEARFRQIADHVSEMFWLVELGPTLVESRVLYVNPAYTRITGRTAETLRSAGGLGLGHVDPADLPAVLEAARAVAAGAPRTVEYRLAAEDGSSRTVRSRMTPIRDAAERVTRIVGFTEDVTEQRTLEAQLRQAQKMEAVGQLAGGVAHDFNNLLTVIGGNLEFAREELGRDHPVQQDLAQVAQAADRARSLVRQLLAFSRRQPVHPQLLRVGDVVRAAERLLQRVIGEEIALATTLGDDAAYVRADAGQIEQVLLNLAVNARDAMLTPLHGHPGTGGVLEIDVDVVNIAASAARTWTDVTPGRWVRLRVRDTGHGMDAETQTHAFEPFFTTKPVDRGTGLGLATVFGIVRQTGGTVRADSAPGRGSTFTILLPAAPAEPGVTAPSGEVEAAPAPGRAATVLLVEDEAALRVTVRRILERRGYSVLEARHGGDALLVWRRDRDAIDAVVTDVRMPEMGGRELAAALQGDRPGLPVVFVTGYADRDAMAAPGEFEAFLEKPFTGDALLATLEALLRRSPSA
jgi:PAS domain S-box-containing protein